MDFLTLAKERFSVRGFSDERIDDCKLETILSAAQAAPTAVDYQPQRLYVVKSTGALSRLSSVRDLFGAPLAIVVCYDDNVSWKNARNDGHDSGEVDAAIVTTHMMLQAWELGIGSCWIGAFSPDAVRETLGIPENEHPVAILSLGYPAEGCKPSEKHFNRKKLEEMTVVI